MKMMHITGQSGKNKHTIMKTYKKTIQELQAFFFSTDENEFVTIFGPHIGSHLWTKYRRAIENKTSVLQHNITLDEVHKFLNNLDLENEKKFNQYMKNRLTNP